MNIKSPNKTLHQIMENKSEQSTTFEVLADSNIMQCIQKLKEQNEYLRKALETAESLIKNYQQENNRLEIQMKIMVCKIRKSQNFMKENRLASEKKCREREVTLAQNQDTQKRQQVEQLNHKIKKLIEIQEKYEEKINEMEHKIVLLQRNNNPKKIIKHQLPLNIGIQTIQSRISTRCTQKEYKAKNLTDLRVFHMKLKNKQLQSQRHLEKNNAGKGLVQRVFSKQKMETSISETSAKKQQTKIRDLRKRH